MPCRWNWRAGAIYASQLARWMSPAGRVLTMRTSPRRCARCSRRCSKPASPLQLETHAHPDRDELRRLRGLDFLVARLDKPGLAGGEREIQTRTRAPGEGRPGIARHF